MAAAAISSRCGRGDAGPAPPEPFTTAGDGAVMRVAGGGAKEAGTGLAAAGCGLGKGPGAPEGVPAVAVHVSGLVWMTPG